MNGPGTLRANNSQVSANCNALGVPATFFQAATALPSRQGGNPALQPEEGRTATFGVVIQPAFFPDFTLTVDATAKTFTVSVSSPAAVGAAFSIERNAQGDLVRGCTLPGTGGCREDADEHGDRW